MSQTYLHQFRVSLHDTDAAGILFFGRVFFRAHEALEGLLHEAGLALHLLIRDQFALLPVVHAESDYQHPLRHGDEVTIRTCVARIGTSSVHFRYLFFVGNQQHASVLVIHANVTPHDGKTCPLPERLVDALTPYLDTP